MTHSHDRTMIARLGFADPDKRNGLHDDLCAYLATPEASTEAVKAISRKLGVWRELACGHEVSFDLRQDYKTNKWVSDEKAQAFKANPEYVHSLQYGMGWSADIFGCARRFSPTGFTNPRARLEQPVIKGSGQYATTVGFLDVVYDGILYLSRCPVHGESIVDKPYSSEARHKLTEHTKAKLYAHSIVFEVKAGHVSPNEVLRQIKFYRGYVNVPVWVVFTGFKYGADDIALLEREGVLVFSAGPKFAAWQKARQEAPATGGDEL